MQDSTAVVKGIGFIHSYSMCRETGFATDALALMYVCVHVFNSFPSADRAKACTAIILTAR